MQVTQCRLDPAPIGGLSPITRVFELKRFLRGFGDRTAAVRFEQHSGVLLDLRRSHHVDVLHRCVQSALRCRDARVKKNA